MSGHMKVSELLAGIEGGAFDETISIDLAALVERIHERGKKGTLTLKFEVVPKGMNNQNVEVKVTHTVSRPTPAAAGHVLYVGDGGSLHKTDPYQQTVFQEDAK